MRQMDSLSRIRSRAEQRRKGRYMRLRPGICSMSGLSNNQAFTVGSAIGQVPGNQPQSTNLVFNTSLPTTGVGTWTMTGGATLTADPTNLFDGGFVPIVAHGAVVTDRINNNTAVVTAATIYTISVYFSVSPQFALANPSPQAAISVNWTGGVAREDKVVFSPANGGILSATAGVTSAHSTQIVATLPSGNPAVIFRIDFQATTPAATTLGEIRIYPRTDAAGNGDIECGGFQIEQLSSVSSFIATTQLGPRSRQGGSIPGQSFGITLPPSHVNANYAYTQGADSGSVFVFDTAGKTFTLNDNSSSATISNNGEFCFVVNNNVGNTTIAAGAGVVITGPGIPAAGVASVTLPISGTGAQTPGATLLMIWDNTAPKTWRIYDAGAGIGGATTPPVTVNFAASPYTIANISQRDVRTFLVTTAGGAVTINLPVVPVDGEIVCIKRITTDATALTIGRSAKNIEGAAADFADQSATLSNYQFQYDAASGGWWIIG